MPIVECTNGNCGPTCGTSLGLIKRLLYSQILYNSLYVSIETNFFYDNDTMVLTPIGEIQRAASQWVGSVTTNADSSSQVQKYNGIIGKQVVPVAVMLDFFAGWTPPRHLYTSNVYRVWGNLPYGITQAYALIFAGPQDYLADNVFNLMYPNYTSSSYV